MQEPSAQKLSGPEPSAQYIWPPFKPQADAPSRASIPLPPVLVSAAQYGSGRTDALRETISDFDQSGFETAYIGKFQPASPRVAVTKHPPVPMQDVCDALVASAHRHHLPVPFFIRLIWQESGFDAHAVSPVGAQGMAQFMPATATQMGLDDPFDPIRALQASARLLRGLIGQFGNLGLAAAAYNAGPKRIADWLQKRGGLPEETRNYVLRITGHAADSWRNTKPGKLGLTVPKRAPCQADADFAAMVEVPVPPPPKPHARARVLAKRSVKGPGKGPAKGPGPAPAGKREQIIINVAGTHRGVRPDPKITIIAAEEPKRAHKRIPARSHARAVAQTSKHHGKTKSQDRVQLAMGPHSSRR